MLKKYTPFIFCLILAFCAKDLFAQESVIEGVVNDKSGVPLEMVQVVLKDQQKSVFTDLKGRYKLERLPAGTYTVIFMLMGYDNEIRQITLGKNESKKTLISLVQKPTQLSDVNIEGKSNTQIVREQAYNITAIDIKPLQNLNLDINQVLNRNSGIRIRQEGGMGSDFSFSLNGFTGNQVKFFIDGMPIDYFGNSLSLNNIPVNIVDRVEIYKGVVPVQFGADALGGAVNIVTTNSGKNYLDVSYSFGSFNSHQAAVVSRVSSKNGFVMNVDGFFNYSDNNYKIKAQLVNPNTGKLGAYQDFERFNDAYRSNTLHIEFGVRNKKAADMLMFGVIASGNRKEVQTGVNMTKVAGEVFRTSESIIPTFKYVKNDLFVKGLSLRVSAAYALVKSAAIDTSSKIYDWSGNYTTRTFGGTSGELSWDKTEFTFSDQSALVTSTLEYNRGIQTLTFNNTTSHFERVGEDPISYNAVPFSSPNTLQKNINGLGYKIDLLNKRWSTTVFGKSFQLQSAVYQENNSGELEQTTSSQQYTGYGMATAFTILQGYQLKVSYENTYRLPEGYELFGDGLLLESNPTLTAEQSKNFNAGILITKRIGKKHALAFDASYIYRRPENMIRLAVIGITSRYENLSSASINGIEGAVKYGYNKWLNLEVNGTYQQLLNTNKTLRGSADPLYLDRLPNIPYLFGNIIIGVQSEERGKRNARLAGNLTSSFVEEFYLKWPSQGNKDYKYIIPQQLSFDASVSYALYKGKYNISLSCLNITNTERYDNFRQQKPGRSFNVKLRYFITQS